MSSSPFPVLDNRPIDKWKVTELKEELKRRRLTTRGLKEELVRRLDEALRVEQEESERLKSAALAAAAEKANQEAQMFPFTGGNFTPDRMQTTPVAPFEAAFRTETTPVAAERTPEPTQSKTTTEASAAVETQTPPPVFLEPEVNAVPFASDKDEKADDVRGDLAGPDSSVVPHDAAAVEEAPSSEQIIHNSENKEPFSGLDDGDSKALPTEAVLENSAMYNQVSEVIPVTGFEESYTTRFKAAMYSSVTKADDIDTSKKGLDIGPSEYSMKDIKDNAVKHFLHLLDTASDQELLALKKIQTVMKKKVVESRPITKIESLKDKGISYKQFADILIKNIEREMEKDDPERMQQKNLKN